MNLDEATVWKEHTRAGLELEYAPAYGFDIHWMALAPL